MRLHLGCGQRYLDGYLNVDYPPAEHTVQTQSPADLHADLLSLRYPHASVSEVRLHHVFEHFQRPVACGLLATWHCWLSPGGILHLEVPDFSRTAAVILNPLSSADAKAVAMRHLFGSHEALWAVHCEGYTQAMLKGLLGSYGFQVTETRKGAWQGTYNVEIIAHKTESISSAEDFRERTRDYLHRYLLDNSATELSLLEAWMTVFDQQLKRGTALHG